MVKLSKIDVAAVLAASLPDDEEPVPVSVFKAHRPADETNDVIEFPRVSTDERRAVIEENVRRARPTPPTCNVPKTTTPTKVRTYHTQGGITHGCSGSPLLSLSWRCI
jgi:hypothetical protein